ncbi:MAG: hypothetical protein B7Y90_09015 [Alphaproteobacteria bacterium 32-64-14]|nr:MAG: hypothetical protein B7Y90_09015 [Alphaproteobacteria bacterium 32-64-14]
MLKRMLVLAVLAAAGAHAYAQPSDIRRTADGRPDFQGVWEARWRTPTERPVEADGPIVAADKADAMVKAMYDRLRAAGNQSPDEDFDFGPLMPAPGGGYRTSLIVEPADGKRPLNQAAQDWAKILKDNTDRAEGSEARGLTERCLRGAGGAPLGVGADQSYRQIIQTPDHVVIWMEQLGDTRIIEMTGRTRPDAVVSWLGHSTGMRVDFIMLRTEASMFESACHEGNHGLEGILRGARVAEARVTREQANNQPAPRDNP